MEMPAGCIPIRLVKATETQYNDQSFYGRQMRDSIERSEGLPVGIQVTGRPNRDEETLAAMKIIEQLTEVVPGPR
jgi:hypothetical protein